MLKTYCLFILIKWFPAIFVSSQSSSVQWSYEGELQPLYLRDLDCTRGEDFICSSRSWFTPAIKDSFSTLSELPGEADNYWWHCFFFHVFAPFYLLFTCVSAASGSLVSVVILTLQNASHSTDLFGCDWKIRPFFVGL